MSLRDGTEQPTVPLKLDVSAEPADLEQHIARWRHTAEANQPLHLATLSAIVRRSVATGRLGALHRWCNKRGIAISRHQLEVFRDLLITRLFDLRDLEPDARRRLRRRQLAGQDVRQMTADYRRGTARGDDLRCRDCRFFVTAPNDGDGRDASGDKSCAALGTKGADAACVGFVRAAAAPR